MALPNKSKGVKRERREARKSHGSEEHASKKKKEDS
jgi:ribosome production factor 2